MESWKTEPTTHGRPTWSASMGPRQRSRGRRCRRRRYRRSSRQLQWGHDNGVVEDSDTGSASPSIVLSFNGATTMESWKTTLGRDRGLAVIASMGPRQWSRGRLRRRRLVSPSIYGFNGATTMESWKTCATVEQSATGRRASMGPRRWSRGRHQDDRRRADRNDASMGPRRWSRGRPAELDRVRSTPHDASMGPRQWSRGRLVGADRIQRPASFNGATTMESWKTRDASHMRRVQC